jgi:hypothetical protein
MAADIARVRYRGPSSTPIDASRREEHDGALSADRQLTDSELSLSFPPPQFPFAAGKAPMRRDAQLIRPKLGLGLDSILVFLQTLKHHI